MLRRWHPAEDGLFRNKISYWKFVSLTMKQTTE